MNFVSKIIFYLLLLEFNLAHHISFLLISHLPSSPFVLRVWMMMSRGNITNKTWMGVKCARKGHREHLYLVILLIITHLDLSHANK